MSELIMPPGLRDIPATISTNHWLAHRNQVPQPDMREAAVLILFGRGQKPRTKAGMEELRRLSALGADDVDVLLLQRSDTLRHHAGQPAFPGGGRDPEDASVIAAALREAQEETGVDPAGVEVINALDPIAVPVSRFQVTPVVAWWPHPTPVRVMDTAESTKVYRVAVADLVAPANRGVFHPKDRAYLTPVFDVGVLKIWGFTAGLLDYTLSELGWSRDWDDDVYMHIDVK